MFWLASIPERHENLFFDFVCVKLLLGYGMVRRALDRTGKLGVHQLTSTNAFWQVVSLTTLTELVVGFWLPGTWRIFMKGYIVSEFFCRLDAVIQSEKAGCSDGTDWKSPRPLLGRVVENFARGFTCGRRAAGQEVHEFPESNQQ